MSDYANAQTRKSKNDKKKKGRYGTYQKGGKYRATGVKQSNKDD